MPDFFAGIYQAGKLFQAWTINLSGLKNIFQAWQIFSGLENLHRIIVRASAKTSRAEHIFNPGIIISVGINKRPWISKFMSYNVMRTAGLKLTAILVQGPRSIPPPGGEDTTIETSPSVQAQAFWAHTI